MYNNNNSITINHANSTHTSMNSVHSATSNNQSRIAVKLPLRPVIKKGSARRQQHGVTQVNGDELKDVIVVGSKVDLAGSNTSLNGSFGNNSISSSSRHNAMASSMSSFHSVSSQRPTSSSQIEKIAINCDNAGVGGGSSSTRKKVDKVGKVGRKENGSNSDYRFMQQQEGKGKQIVQQGMSSNSSNAQKIPMQKGITTNQKQQQQPIQPIQQQMKQQQQQKVLQSNKKPIQPQPQQQQQSLKTSKSLKLFNFDDTSQSDALSAFDSLIQSQKHDQYYQVHKFLTETNQPHLFDLFIRNKIYDLDSIRKLTKPKLSSMKVSSQDITKIANHLQSLNKPKPPQPSSTSSTVQEGGTDPMPTPSNQDLLDFEENERLQAELFRKAVEEFRNAGKTKEETAPPLNESEQALVADPKRFLMELGGNALFNLNNVALFADEGNDVKDDNEYLAELAVGKACWNCFKKISEIYPLSMEQKFFCGKKCLDEYKKINEKKCSFCGKVFLKGNGVYSKNRVFCSMSCYEKDKDKIEENENEEDEEAKPYVSAYTPKQQQQDDDDVIDILDI